MSKKPMAPIDFNEKVPLRPVTEMLNDDPRTLSFLPSLMIRADIYGILPREVLCLTKRQEAVISSAIDELAKSDHLKDCDGCSEMTSGKLLEITAQICAIARKACEVCSNDECGYRDSDAVVSDRKTLTAKDLVY